MAESSEQDVDRVAKALAPPKTAPVPGCECAACHPTPSPWYLCPGPSHDHCTHRSSEDDW